MRNVTICVLLCIIAILLTALTAIKTGKAGTNKDNNKANIKLTKGVCDFMDSPLLSKC